MARNTLAFAAITGCKLAAMAFTAPGHNAQPEREIKATKLAEHPIARMIGRWEGTASRIGRNDGQWHKARGVERAHWNLAGSAIIVEGYGYIDEAESGERSVGHDAIGVIEWDDQANAPVFFAHLSGGPDFAKHRVETVAGTDQIRWGMQPAPDVQMRFTITLTESRWLEVGEMSRDEGKTWMKVMETDLQRVEDWPRGRG